MSRQTTPEIYWSADKYPEEVKPVNVALVGSMKFYKEWVEVKNYLESRGVSVAIPDPDGEDWNRLSKQAQIERKSELGERQLARIIGSKVLLIANYKKNGVDGYIGPNTLAEIIFANEHKKPIFSLYDIPKGVPFDLHNFDEDDLSEIFGNHGIKISSLSGDLKKLVSTISADIELFELLGGVE